jgi:hypothetical protein
LVNGKKRNLIGLHARVEVMNLALGCHIHSDLSCSFVKILFQAIWLAAAANIPDDELDEHVSRIVSNKEMGYRSIHARQRAQGIEVQVMYTDVTVIFYLIAY